MEKRKAANFNENPALDDTSKIQIQSILQPKPKYNTEINPDIS